MRIGIVGAGRIGSSQASIRVAPDGFGGTVITSSMPNHAALLNEIAGAR